MILKATLKNLTALSELNSVVQDIHSKNEPDIFRSHTQLSAKKWFKSFLQQKNNHILIAQDDTGLPIGYIAFTFKNDKGSPLTLPKKVMYIHHIAVNKNWQSKKIGEGLLKDALKAARQKKITRIELDVWAFNEGAIKFFEKQGFKTYNIKKYLNLN